MGFGTLLKQYTNKETYKSFGSNGEFFKGFNDISESSDRLNLLKNIKKLQTAFSRKWKEYIQEKHSNPDSQHAKQLYSECEDLHVESGKLIDLL